MALGIPGDGYAPTGDLVSAGTQLDVAGSLDVLELLRACVLCNDAALASLESDEEWKGLGNPTEVACRTRARSP